MVQNVLKTLNLNINNVVCLSADNRKSNFVKNNSLFKLLLHILKIYSKTTKNLESNVCTQLLNYFIFLRIYIVNLRTELKIFWLRSSIMTTKNRKCK